MTLVGESSTPPIRRPGRSRRPRRRPDRLRTGDITSECSPRIRVAFIECGGGHRSVAEALEMVLRTHTDGGGDIESFDALGVISRRVDLARYANGLYRWVSMPNRRFIYRALFSLVDRFPEVTAGAASLVFGRRARQWLHVSQPELIVSTYPIVSLVLGQAIQKAQHPTKLVTLVTDGGRVNRTWFAGRSDGWLVTDDDALAFGESTQRGARIEKVALPLRAGFEVSRTQAISRRRLGLGQGPVVLVWGGAHGLAAGTEEIAKELRRTPSAPGAIFVIGDNYALGARLEQIALPDWRIMADCDDIPTMLAAADVVVGKAGWVSLQEAAAVGRHTICFDSLPGQEAENLRVMMKRGTVTWEPDPSKLVALTCTPRLKPICVPENIASAHAELARAVFAYLRPEEGACCD